MLCLLACAAWAQQDSAPPTFEVASVKVAAEMSPMQGGGGAMRTFGCGKPDPALVRCTGASLKTLLMRAYGVEDYQIEGPAWISSERYDVMAKVPEGVPADKVPAMLQALLAERFGAKIHKETRTLAAYEMTLAKGGPKFAETDPTKLRTPPEPGSAAPPPQRRHTPPTLNEMPVGAIMFRMSRAGARTVRGNITIEQLVTHLTYVLDRPILDHTGLEGTYAIDFTYLGDENDGMGRRLPATVPPPVADPGDSRQSPDSDAPIATLFQALQQSLGLKLEAKKAPVEMIVVDSANKVPTEN
ncbi:MAG TPA: TIGR03435 family protein [Bryobacteraceae bacterium]|jgi:uncharacterized protein (TIGR03435 family)|nr:TIGR03435 family protein [Bryobacteraceae bacterium]